MYNSVLYSCLCKYALYIKYGKNTGCKFHYNRMKHAWKPKVTLKTSMVSTFFSLSGIAFILTSRIMEPLKTSNAKTILKSQFQTLFKMH